MEFRTELFLTKPPFELSFQSKMLALGSCFAEVMGGKLKSNKFDTIVNPFGVIFNPVSIQKLLQTAVEGRSLDGDLVEREGRWYHLDLHSHISASTKGDLQKRVNELMAHVNHFLQETDILLLTLGTAFVYRRSLSNAIVANCHKLPASQFTKELLSVSQITNSIDSVCQQLIAIRPNLHIIVTVSPVRHIKDGISENQASKSILRVACHELATKWEQIHYFPSYELMMDDLRDYRFYKGDMIHPSEVAEEYIWNKFIDAYTSDQTKNFINEWAKLKTALAHKPFHPESEAHQRFLKKILVKLEALHKAVNVEEEINLLKSQIRG